MSLFTIQLVQFGVDVTQPLSLNTNPLRSPNCESEVWKNFYSAKWPFGKHDLKELTPFDHKAAQMIYKQLHWQVHLLFLTFSFPLVLKGIICGIFYTENDIFKKDNLNTFFFFYKLYHHKLYYSVLYLFTLLQLYQIFAFVLLV